MKFITLFLPLLFVFNYSLAADHLDGTAVMTDASTDITDIYAWVPAAGKLALIMNVHPLAATGSAFSTAASYVLHVNSSASYGATQTEATVTCTFVSNTDLSCDINGTALVTNVDATATTGVSNADSTFKIFAGLRSDPFFFDLNNFNVVRTTVRDAAPDLTFDGAGCPTLDDATRNALVGTLQAGNGGLAGEAAPSDFFASLNTLSIVIEADQTLFGAGPVYSVSGSTLRN